MTGRTLIALPLSSAVLLLLLPSPAGQAQGEAFEAIRQQMGRLQVQISALQSTLNNVQASVGALNAVQSSVNNLQAATDNVETAVGALDTLQSSVNKLQTTTNGVRTAVSALKAPQSNVRSTPPLWVGDTVAVDVTNVGRVPHQIKVELVDWHGNATVIYAGDVALDPGASTGRGQNVPGWGFYWARFTVLDGSRSDIRGALFQKLNGLDIVVAAE